MTWKEADIIKIYSYMMNKIYQRGTSQESPDAVVKYSNYLVIVVFGVQY